MNDKVGLAGEVFFEAGEKSGGFAVGEGEIVLEWEGGIGVIGRDCSERLPHPI